MAEPGYENMFSALATDLPPIGGVTSSTSGIRGIDPPHVISVNQLDPLRDEGLTYFRKLLEARVSAVSRTVNGTCHAGHCMFRGAMPDVYLATIRDIKSPADSL